MNIKSEKAKEFIEEHKQEAFNSEVMLVSGVKLAVAIAEEEMKQKAIVEFCNVICCDYDSSECRATKPCKTFELFLNQLNS